jgi:hypothetical protein
MPADVSTAAIAIDATEARLIAHATTFARDREPVLDLAVAVSRPVVPVVMAPVLT